MGDYRMVGDDEDGGSAVRDAGLGPVCARAEKSPQGRAHLLQTIEGEIIPRLMLVHRVPEGVRVPAANGQLRPSARDVDELARRVLDGDADQALRYVESVLHRGVPLEAVYLELFSPTARYLGTRWETDQSDFMQVPMGLWRLQ